MEDQKKGLLLFASASCILLAFIITASSGEIPDGVVYTDVHKTARKGDELALKCQFFGTPFGVYWKKGDDPRTSPNLITRVNGIPPSGLCVDDGSCRMGSDFSLIINETVIADRGTYICRVSNYRGITIHNFTDVDVFAPPMEPFPVINECRGKLSDDTEQSCTISTPDNVIITCSASSYFPDVNLFFIHGSQKTVTIYINEMTNIDGTRNKSISTNATASEIPYVCVASDIPGLQGQRTMTVTVNNVPMTTTSPMDKMGGSEAKVVTPVTVTVLIVLAAVCLCCVCLWRRHRRRNRWNRVPRNDPETSPLDPGLKIEGKISFFELWCLVKNMQETDFPKLRNVIMELGVPGVKEDTLLTRDNAYDLLCDWKDTNDYLNEGVKLRNMLSHAGIDAAWSGLQERRSSESRIPRERLDYIIRQIGEEQEIDLFLLELITDKTTVWTNPQRKKENILKEATSELIRWRDRLYNASHDIMLSLALERAKCKPLDRTFFKIPLPLLKAISAQEVKTFVYRLTGRHCRRLATTLGITDDNEIEAILDGNNEDLFDAESMTSDWIAGQECSNLEKRCRLDDAIIKIGRHDMTGFFETNPYRIKRGSIPEQPHPDAKHFNAGSIFDDDLLALEKYLPSHAIRPFLERLGISLEDGDGNLEEKLRGWRDRKISKSKELRLQDLLLIYTEVLNDPNGNNVIGLKDGELENVVENLSTEQVQDLTSRLGIDIHNQQENSVLEHLKTWRDSLEMEKCRRTLRQELFGMELSECIVSRLPSQHVYEAEMVRLAFGLLYTDVGPLATLLGMDTSKVKTPMEPLKGTVGLLIQLLDKGKDQDEYRRRDFCVALINLGYLDVARWAYLGYEASFSELCRITTELQDMGNLMDHLELDKTVLTVGRGTTEPNDFLKLITVWRNQLRPEPIHFRLKLALYLRAIGLTEKAYDVLAGKFRTTEVDSRVVERMSKSLEDDRLKRIFGEHGLHALTAQKSWTTTEGVVEWVRNWLKQLENTPAEKNIIKGMFSSRRRMNDELFRAGFFELAEEIMLLEFPTFPSV